jgi:ribosomal protein L35
MKVKTNKTVAKRFKITKKAKVLKRYAGQDHFNTRDTGTATRKKRRDVSLSHSFDKTVKTAVSQ